MTKTLLLGLGGTGSRIINFVAEDLKDCGMSINNGDICCAVLDTNENDNTNMRKARGKVPVYATSKDRTIESYMAKYVNDDVAGWMPISPALLRENMIDGASQMRPKSRLAFHDALEDNDMIHFLKDSINQLFNDLGGNESNIRVMIASSLAGGTGSGMFIQTALWLRSYLASKGCEKVTIRGIFLMPDVFINTIEDIRKDKRQQRNLYANAYGSVQEMNIITKLKTKEGASVPAPIRIGKLFDSTRDCPDGNPLYNYVFFVDYTAQNGSVLGSIREYEQAAARLIYMQMFAPMKSDLYSEEDNLFSTFDTNPEPVFGSCGTAKAVYPRDDIVRYCALRALKDALTDGWNKIDREIRETQHREEEREKNGEILTHKINVRDEYIRLFDVKSSKTGNQVGSDRLFVSIAKDILNEKTYTDEDGNVGVSYTDKIEDFMSALEISVAEQVDTADLGSLSEYRLKPLWLENNTAQVDELLQTVKRNRRKLQDDLLDIEETANENAGTVAERICPSFMDEINQADSGSIYGFLTKTDQDQKTYFVHPLAARYLLYRLVKRLTETGRSIDTEHCRGDVMKGFGNGTAKASFDYAKTKRVVEKTPEEYLTALGEERKPNPESLNLFKKNYFQLNQNEAELSRAYAIALVKKELIAELVERLEVMIKALDRFFMNLTAVSKTIDSHITHNIQKNAQPEGKRLYICASETEKEAIYRDLGLDTAERNDDVNRLIVRAIYQTFCMSKNVKKDEKEPVTVMELFFRDSIRSYTKRILTECPDKVDMDIFDAVSRSVDILQEGREEETADILDVDLDEEEEDRVDFSEYDRAMEQVLQSLRAMSAPMMRFREETPEKTEKGRSSLGSSTQKEKTYWGFHPSLTAKLKNVALLLGGNLEKQSNTAYLKNEIDCYQAVYGVEAQDIPPFNEMENGLYYANYREIVDEMIRGESIQKMTELVKTPHLDKTWHKILPYVTPEMQAREEGAFFRLFWLAVGYGMLTLKEDQYYIERTHHIAVGQTFTTMEPVLWEEEPIRVSEIGNLIAFLKQDGMFSIDGRKWFEVFAKEVKDGGMENSRVFRQLSDPGELNALSLIVLYDRIPNRSITQAANMVLALESLLREMTAPAFRSQEDAEDKCMELCRKIRDNCSQTDKKMDIIRHWDN